MADFSRPPEDELTSNVTAGYVGLHFEQGVPILDRDLNLLQDLIVASVRSIMRGFVGNGVSADSSAFAVEEVPAANDVLVRAGPPGARSLLVDGIEISLDGDVRFSAQRLHEDEDMTTPTTGQRVDIVYLDVDIETVEGLPELANPHDVGMQTSVRLRPRFRVRVAPGADAAPDADPGHHHYALARITRRAGIDVIGASAIEDLRQTRVNLAEVARRVAAVEELRVHPFFDPAEPFTPPGSQVNTSVLLNGRNFDIPPVTVRFGTVVVQPDEVTATTVRLKVPADVPPGPVSVGISTGGGEAVAAMQFAVDGTVPPPVITGFTPPSGDAGTSVTIAGQNFNVAGLEVRFGDRKATEATSNADGTSINARVPTGVAGLVKIFVATQGSAGTPTPSVDDFVAGPQPAFTRDSAGGKQFEPTTEHPGGPVTISGQHLDLVTRVVLERVQPQPSATKEVAVFGLVAGAVTGTRLQLTLPSDLGLQSKHQIRLFHDSVSVVSDDVLTISQV